MNTENTTINCNGVQVSVRKDSAATYYIRHPNASYGIFCFNEAGDLFLNSDWGMYGFAWRSYGKDFREFLAQTNADYIFQKFDTNTRYPPFKRSTQACSKACDCADRSLHTCAERRT